MKAISIPGPWWWFLFYPPAFVRKDVITHKEPCNFRGWCLIHAGDCVEKQFDDACDFARGRGVPFLPKYETLKRGGIVGMVKIVAYAERYASPWSGGRPVLVLEGAEPEPFWPCAGGAGFFEPVTVPGWKPKGTVYANKIDKPSER